MAKIPQQQAADNARQQISGRLSGGAGKDQFGSGPLTSGRTTPVTVNPVLMNAPQQRAIRQTPLTQGFTEPAFGPSQAAAVGQGLTNLARGFAQAEETRKKQEAFDEANLINRQVKQAELEDAEFFERYASFPPLNITDLYQQHVEERGQKVTDQFQGSVTDNGFAALQGELNSVDTKGMVKAIGIKAHAKSLEYVVEFNRDVRESQAKLLSPTESAPAAKLADEIGRLQLKISQGKEARAYSEPAAKILQDQVEDLQVIVGIALAEQGRVAQAEKVLSGSLFSLKESDRNKIRSAIGRATEGASEEDKVLLKDRAKEEVARTVRTGDTTLTEQDFKIMGVGVSAQFEADLREDIRIAGLVHDITEGLRAGGPEQRDVARAKLNQSTPEDFTDRKAVEIGVAARIQEHINEWANNRTRIAFEDQGLNDKFRAWKSAEDQGLPETAALGQAWRDSYILWQKRWKVPDKEIQVASRDTAKTFVGNLNGNIGDPHAFIATVAEMRAKFPGDHSRRLVNQLSRMDEGSKLEGVTQIFLSEVDDPIRLVALGTAFNLNLKEQGFSPEESSALESEVLENSELDDFRDSYNLSPSGDKMATAYEGLVKKYAAFRMKTLNETRGEAIDNAVDYVINSKFKVIELDGLQTRMPLRGEGFDLSRFRDGTIRGVLYHKLNPESGSTKAKKVLETIDVDDLSGNPMFLRLTGDEAEDRKEKQGQLETEAFWHPQTEGLMLAVFGSTTDALRTGLVTPWRRKDGEEYIITWKELAAEALATVPDELFNFQGEANPGSVDLFWRNSVPGGQ